MIIWFIVFLILIQPTISLEMPVPSQGHYGFHSFPVVDWFCRAIGNTAYYTCKLIFLLKKDISTDKNIPLGTIQFPPMLPFNKGNNKITELRSSSRAN
jgi:hypothetical protein